MEPDHEAVFFVLAVRAVPVDVLGRQSEYGFLEPLQGEPVDRGFGGLGHGCASKVTVMTPTERAASLSNASE